MQTHWSGKAADLGLLSRLYSDAAAAGRDPGGYLEDYGRIKQSCVCLLAGLEVAQAKIKDLKERLRYKNRLLHERFGYTERRPSDASVSVLFDPRQGYPDARADAHRSLSASHAAFAAAFLRENNDVANPRRTAVQSPALARAKDQERAHLLARSRVAAELALLRRRYQQTLLDTKAMFGEAPDAGRRRSLLQSLRESVSVVDRLDALQHLGAAGSRQQRRHAELARAGRRTIADRIFRDPLAATEYRRGLSDAEASDALRASAARAYGRLHADTEAEAAAAADGPAPPHRLEQEQDSDDCSADFGWAGTGRQPRRGARPGLHRSPSLGDQIAQALRGRYAQPLPAIQSARGAREGPEARHDAVTPEDYDQCSDPEVSRDDSTLGELATEIAMLLSSHRAPGQPPSGSSSRAPSLADALARSARGVRNARGAARDREGGGDGSRQPSVPPTPLHGQAAARVGDNKLNLSDLDSNCRHIMQEIQSDASSARRASSTRSEASERSQPRTARGSISARRRGAAKAVRSVYAQNRRGVVNIKAVTPGASAAAPLRTVSRAKPLAQGRPAAPAGGDARSARGREHGQGQSSERMHHQAQAQEPQPGSLHDLYISSAEKSLRSASSEDAPSSIVRTPGYALRPAADGSAGAAAAAVAAAATIATAPTQPPAPQAAHAAETAQSMQAAVSASASDALALAPADQRRSAVRLGGREAALLAGDTLEDVRGDCARRVQDAEADAQKARAESKWLAEEIARLNGALDVERSRYKNLRRAAEGQLERHSRLLESLASDDGSRVAGGRSLSVDARSAVEYTRMRLGLDSGPARTPGPGPARSRSCRDGSGSGPGSGSQSPASPTASLAPTVQSARAGRYNRATLQEGEMRIHNDLVTAERQLAVLQTRYEALQKRYDAHRDSVFDAGKAMQETAALGQRCTALAEEAALARDRLAAAQDEAAGLRREASALRSELDSANASRALQAEATGRADDLSQRLAAAVRDRDDLLARVDEDERTLLARDEEIVKLRQGLFEATRQVGAFKEALSEAQDRAAGGAAGHAAGPRPGLDGLTQVSTEVESSCEDGAAAVAAAAACSDSGGVNEDAACLDVSSSVVHHSASAASLQQDVSAAGASRQPTIGRSLSVGVLLPGGTAGALLPPNALLPAAAGPVVGDRDSVRIVAASAATLPAQSPREGPRGNVFMAYRGASAAPPALPQSQGEDAGQPLQPSLPLPPMAPSQGQPQLQPQAQQPATIQALNRRAPFLSTAPAATPPPGAVPDDSLEALVRKQQQRIARLKQELSVAREQLQARLASSASTQGDAGADAGFFATRLHAVVRELWQAGVALASVDAECIQSLVDYGFEDARDMPAGAVVARAPRGAACVDAQSSPIALWAPPPAAPPGAAVEGLQDTVTKLACNIEIKNKAIYDLYQENERLRAENECALADARRAREDDDAAKERMRVQLLRLDREYKVLERRYENAVQRALETQRLNSAAAQGPVPGAAQGAAALRAHDSLRMQDVLDSPRPPGPPGPGTDALLCEIATLKQRLRDAADGGACRTCDVLRRELDEVRARHEVVKTALMTKETEARVLRNEILSLRRANADLLAMVDSRGGRPS